ncbi:hypothetical protein [Litoreibacter ascidiaceicola]|nr:hypothetical protein [Litoreibacter ascidiaceicola]
MTVFYPVRVRGARGVVDLVRRVYWGLIGRRNFLSGGVEWEAGVLDI